MTKLPCPIHISDVAYAELLALLQQYLPGVSVWAYGSRITSQYRATSDLDLVVFTEDKSAVYDLKEAFEESNLPFCVDLFLWDEIPDSFHKTIKHSHVVIQ